jgi:hypothetical protein
MYKYDIACKTIGCLNEGIVINVPNPDVEPTIICGPCGLQITDYVQTDFIEDAEN